MHREVLENSCFKESYISPLCIYYGCLLLNLSFPFHGWNWKRVGPLVHIYCSALREDNFVPLFYDICYHFMGSIYQNIFKEYAPTFSSEPKHWFLLWEIGMLVTIFHILEFEEETHFTYCLRLCPKGWC